MAKENKEEMYKTRRKEGEKEENETERVCFCGDLKFLVKKTTWGIVVIFLGEIFWRSLRTSN